MLTPSTHDEILTFVRTAPTAEVVSRIEQLQAEVQQLTARVQTLEQRLRLDSHNSGLPPSRDSAEQRSRRRERNHSLRKPSTRPTGGQPGHPGTTLAPVPHPDMVVVHRPRACAACHLPLPPVGAVRATEVRQVFDLPPLRLKVTEHRAETCDCPHCGHPTPAPFPPGVEAPVQYGPQVQALAVQLNVHECLPLARLQGFFADVFGQPLCEATLLAQRERAAAALAPLAAAIREGLQGAPVVGADETSCYVGRTRYWLHVLCTDQLTDFELSVHRGTQHLETHAWLQRYTGVLEHDAYDSYFHYGMPHGLCNAHLLRNLAFLEEEEHAATAAAWQRLLRELHTRVKELKAAGEPGFPAGEWAQWEHRYGRLLARSLAQTPEVPTPPGTKQPPKQSRSRNLFERLRDRRTAVLAFATNFDVPFDNNQAERDLRMYKVQQKVSGNFRSLAGAQAFVRVYGYLLTARKQGILAYEALRRLFAGHPFEPRVPT